MRGNFLKQVQGIISKAIPYLFKASFTAANQGFINSQVLDTSAEGVQTGSMTVKNGDSTNPWSIASNLLFCDAQAYATYPPYAYAPSRSRVVGQSFIGTCRLEVLDAGYTGPYFGYLDTITNPGHANNIGSFAFYNGFIYCHPSSMLVKAFSVATDYKFAVVDNGSNAFHMFMHNGTKWILEHIIQGSTVTIYPGLMCRQQLAGRDGTFKDIKIPDIALPNLLTPASSDTSVVTEDTFTHIADCYIESLVTTLPSSGNYDIEFRIQDANNKWILRTTSAGTVSLIEVVTGTPTTRGTSGTALANGQIIKCIAEDDDITFFVNNVGRTTYASATNFKTATSGKVVFGSGAISYIKTWARGTNNEYTALDVF